MRMPNIPRRAATALVACLTIIPAFAVEAPAPAATRVSGVKVPPLWLKQDGKPVQPLTITLRHAGNDVEASVQVDGVEAAKVALKAGEQAVDLKVPASEQPRSVALRVMAAGKELAATTLDLKPPQIREMWVWGRSLFR